jgi:PGF-pre-PGF domain-containing protein
MKINKQKLIAILLVAILIALIPLVAAAPSGTSESTVVEAAKSWIGVKSVHGGDNKSGIDCSHLVFQVYKQAGAKGIVFQTVPNMKKNAYYVNTTSPTPGDVIFWKKDITQNNRNYWLVSHVGIYIGNEQFIDTSFDTKLVATESISGVYKDGMPYYARWDPGSGNSNESNLPVAAFSVSPASGKAPLNVAFTDKSTGATSWSWTFGDESTSAEKNPTHTYSAAGNYTVVLTVNNENGSNSKTLNIIVQEEQIQEKILPVANFDGNPTSGSAPLSVQFTDRSQNENEWNWNFGDGNISTEQHPVNTYYSPGTYTVNLTVTNPNGMNSKLATITVLSKPVANFNVNVTSGYAPLSVQFTDISQNAVSWSWDFSDDGVPDSIDQNPVYQYTAPGSYTVKLTISNENGNSSTTQTIIVQDPEYLPIADFSTNVTSGYAPLSVQFSDLSQNLIGRGWDFNNDWQIDSADAAPVYVFTEPGSYNVNLIATNENGTSTKTTIITVLEESSSDGSSSGSQSSSDGSGNGESSSDGSASNGSTSDGSSNSGSSGSHSSGGSHHSSGGSSGGGTGGSPEPQKNVAVKDTTKVFISGDKPVYFNFTNDVTVVDYISFTSEKTVGKTTAIVEDLKNKSFLVSKLPDGIVYKSFNVWVGNAGYGDSNSILDATISFKVDKSWIQENDIDPSSIVLHKYDDEKKEWGKLPVNLETEDNQFLHFTANVPGYSSFVITGEKEEKSTLTPEPVTTSTASSIKDNTSTIAAKTTEGNEKSPGFGAVSEIICLVCMFLYRIKDR